MLTRALRAAACLLLLSGLVLGACEIAMATSDEGIPVAILDLDALGGTSKGDVQIVSEHYRNLVFETGRYVVVARDKTSSILDELRLQMSGPVEESQAVEAGRMLGVHKIFFGSVGRLGSTYSLHLQLVDVKTGRVEADRTGQYACRLEDLPACLGALFPTLFMPGPSVRPNPPPSAGPADHDPTPPPRISTPPPAATPPPREQPSGGPWRILFGTYSTKGNALDRAQYLSSEGYPSEAFQNREEGALVYYVLYKRGFASRNDAESVAALLRRQGISVQVITAGR